MDFSIIFDMDGVIVHSNPAHKKAIHQFCEQHDLHISEVFMRENIYGCPNKEWIPKVFKGISAEKIEEYGREKEQIFRDIFNPKDHIVKGILQFLDSLRDSDIPMSIATSAPIENANYILSHLSITDYFTTILASSHVTNGKPDPEIYLKTAKALDKDPKNCVVIEDSVSGVKAGLNAGAKVVGVTTTHTTEELRDCDLIIDDFDGLNIKDLQQLF